MKISTKKILLIGGVTALGKCVDSVFCFDLEKDYTIEQLDKIDKAGVIDYPIILDQIGNLHLMLEKNNGTSPPDHVIYSFLEYSWYENEINKNTINISRYDIFKVKIFE